LFAVARRITRPATRQVRGVDARVQGRAKGCHLAGLTVADERMGGQQPERHHRAGAGNAGGEVVGCVEAVEEGRARGVVDG
jgi:hypothetical protein